LCDDPPVSAVDSSEVERRILADAIAAGEKKREAEQQRIQAALAAADAASSTTDAAAAPSSTSAAAISTVSAAVPPAKSRSSTRAIADRGDKSANVRPSRRPHPPPAAAAALSSPRDFGLVLPLESPPPPATHKGQFRRTGAGAAAAARVGASNASTRGPSIIHSASRSRTSICADEKSYEERQRQIETGEMTPFADMGGEKGFRRQQTARVHQTAPIQRAHASGSRGVSAAAPASASAAAAMPSSPYPSYMQGRTPRTSSASASASVSSASGKKHGARKEAKPSPAKARPAATKRKETASSKRRKRSDSSSSSSLSDSSDVAIVSESRHVSKPKSTHPTQPWTCEACTYINPSDFSRRCEMCHTVRKRAAAEEAKVKIEEAAEKMETKRSKYKEVSSSDEEAREEDEDEYEEKEEESSDEEEMSGNEDEEVELYPSKKRRTGHGKRDKQKKRKRKRQFGEDDDGGPATVEHKDNDEMDSDDIATVRADDSDAFISDESDVDEDESLVASMNVGGRRRLALLDDYSDDRYLDRVEAWREHLAAATAAAAAEPGEGEESQLDVVFDGGYILPAYLWNKLFAYQKTSIKWCWELHFQNVGGIIADEMGLGKTIQVVAFLAGLHYSAQHHALNPSGDSSSSSDATNQFRQLGPSLIIVPATILSQWLREFHEWYPEMRVIVLHDSVAHDSPVSKRDLVAKLFERGSTGGVLITTYQQLRTCKHLLLPREWGYVVLDEGHKIKTPDAAITLLCKQLLTVHRLLLTGSPIQNNLTELWSLFDFIFPGKLGTLPVFEDEFAFPILQGGYTSASPVQIALAYRCAIILRDIINPYILRRVKSDVAQHLPPKNEQVLFCNLTHEQYALYQNFLGKHANEIADITAGKLSLFRVIHYLRKIVNHPDLLEVRSKQQSTANKNKRRRRDADEYGYGYDDESDGEVQPSWMSSIDPKASDSYGSVDRSGKLKVVQQVLRMWHEQGHRCLLFSQTRQMLDILERFVRKEGYTYRRVDGSTSIRARLPLIDEFNRDSSIFIMLLTTRAGGLGVNLVGADRVLLYDPDWNPSSDEQARERAYRIGQVRPVTVYRLITRGCIEEKVYHRQIWKRFLTDKVLRDPKQKRFFSAHDIKDLFTLAPMHHARGSNKANKHHATTHTETANIFKASQSEITKEDAMRELKEEESAQQMKVDNDAAMRDHHDIVHSTTAEPIVKQEPHPSLIHLAAAAPHDADSTEQKEASMSPSGVASRASPSRVSAPHRVSASPTKQTVKPEPSPSPSPELDIQQYHAGDEVSAIDSHAQSVSDDNRILAALFSKDGIQSAMNHDRILNANGSDQKKVVVSLAQKAANKAVAALKKSRLEMRNQPVNQPTWTGRSGTLPPMQSTSALAAGASLSSSSSSSAVARPRFGAQSRRPIASSRSVADSSSSATHLATEAVQEGRLRSAALDASASASASPASAHPTHFDTSQSGFSRLSSLPSTSPSSAADADADATHTGARMVAASSASLLQRMRQRAYLSSTQASPASDALTHAPESRLMDDDNAMDYEAEARDRAAAAAAAGRSALPHPTSQAASSSSSSASSSSSLLSSLRSTLSSCPDGLTSVELIDLFGEEIGDDVHAQVMFRQMLRSIADFKGKKKTGRWRLKEEFQ